MNAKKLAGEKAVEQVKEGMVVGLGTGSTAYWAVQKLGELVKDGLHIKAIPTSKSTEKLAIELNIPLVSFSEINEIDLTIDGADEINPTLDLIKGGGGALLREKIVAHSSKKFVVIADESKLVNHLGSFPLPVEVTPFGLDVTKREIQNLRCNTILRQSDASNIFITDNGNYILDCYFESIIDPSIIHTQLNMIPGVVENGLFVNMAEQVIIGYNDGRLKVLEK
ncbi:ribose-5-phosphate isomerase RpiA [Chengkuizengella axinellae]|uniref:Ribose-5-phosphate isomerase A n=1 Tax=Chengkuizengella axinellae TaxID=3064388 RepID=A0ABT9IU67_9BACL|nr:ribose-5-phosphate isomerase RpiA [Chengkuizengella sp. 2205SS18-9]MDP5272842.1 ribose-5-phosphate isomerase RpiA [Chengkuizengella sp. 2205SS18-9]